MKRFNPKRCPYEQLKEHHGEALVFVVNKKEAPSRLRLVRRDRKYGGFVVWQDIHFDPQQELKLETLADRKGMDWIGCVSCYEEDLKDAFTISFVKYERVIEAMKWYDEDMGFTIFHIDFN